MGRSNGPGYCGNSDTKDCKVSWLFLLALENVKREKEKFTQNTLRQLESLQAL